MFVGRIGHSSARAFRTKIILLRQALRNQISSSVPNFSYVHMTVVVGTSKPCTSDFENYYTIYFYEARCLQVHTCVNLVSLAAKTTRIICRKKTRNDDNGRQ